MPDFTRKELETIYLKKRVNIYRELRIHLFYKSILKREAHESIQIYDVHQFYKLYNPIILSSY